MKTSRRGWQRQRGWDSSFIFSSLYSFIEASPTLPPLHRWKDGDADCLTISSYYHSPTPSIRLTLQLDEPTTARLHSLTEPGFEDCILTFVIRCGRGLSQGLLHLVHSWELLRQRRAERHHKRLSEWGVRDGERSPVDVKRSWRISAFYTPAPIIRLIWEEKEEGGDPTSASNLSLWKVSWWIRTCPTSPLWGKHWFTLCF